jgi:hypothetical protein
LGSALIYRLSVNPVFTTRAFWQPYLYPEPEGVNADDIARQLAVLQTDFPVREDQVPFELQGRQHVAIRRVVEFSFRCSDRYSLLIEYELEVQGCMTVLFLVDRQSGTKSQMGWSDLARWHPYCLHPEEFDALLADWERHDPRWHGQHLPLLLLCQFVGLPDSSSRDSLSARAEAALAAVCPEGRMEIPLHVPEDYAWEHDPELGWLFTSDTYCCLSTRNRQHLDSDEHHFPFAAFQELMAAVRRRDPEE